MMFWINCFFRLLLGGILASFVFLPQAMAAPESATIRVGGSTTLLPIIAKCASDFMEKYKTWDKVDPSLPKDDIVIFVSGGGSGFGVKATLNGTVHIGLASRNLKDKEKELLGSPTTFLVGKDAVAIAAHHENPLATSRKGFKSSELADIFSGDVNHFTDLDPSLPGKPIVLFVRDSGAGSAEIFQKLIMKDRPISSNALQLPSQGALLKKLESNKFAIGYISSGLAFSSEELRAFEVDGTFPSNENVIAGKYSLTRPLLMVVKGAPSPMAKYFIDYVLSDGQEVVAANNYVPAAKANR